MSGKKKKIYHQKFGQHILTKSKLPIPSRPPPAPGPNASKVSWLATQSAQNQKQITRKKIKRRQIFRTGVDFFEIRFVKTVIEVNHGPGGHFVLLSSWKKFCVPGKIHRKRFVQFLEIVFEWITRNGIFLSFQVLYHFQCVYGVSKIAHFNIDISYFLLTHIFYRTGQVYIQPNSKILQRMLLTNTCHTMHSRFINFL